MNNKRKKEYLILIVLLLIIGIGYAAIASNLKINGVANVLNSKFDVHFDNITVTNESVEIDTVRGDLAARVDPNDGTKLDYIVVLDKPGDIYEFTVDVVNAGTVDAIIEEVISTLIINDEEPIEVNETNMPVYLYYNLTYEDGSEILANHTLESSQRETYRLVLKYKNEDIDPEDLPDEQKILSFSVKPKYRQLAKAVASNSNSGPSWDTNPATYDGELVDGAQFVDGQYTYTYMEAGEYYLSDSPTDLSLRQNGDYSIATPTYNTTGGWHVQVTDRDSYEPITEPLRTTINDKPIISLYGTFYKCNAQSIDFSNFYTGNVINMIGVFYDSGTPTLDLSNFDTKNVISMTNMFSGSSATTINGLDKFDTRKVVNMGYMFNNTRAQVLDLSSFDTSHVRDMRGMFSGNSLQTIYASNKFVTTGIDLEDNWWSSEGNNAEFVFYASHLVGGNGTHYITYKNDASYAKIDKPGQEGYFTEKN